MESQEGDEMSKLQLGPSASMRMVLDGASSGVVRVIDDLSEDINVLKERLDALEARVPREPTEASLDALAPKTEGMTWPEAVQAMKEGKRVERYSERDRAGLVASDFDATDWRVAD